MRTLMGVALFLGLVGSARADGRFGVGIRTTSQHLEAEDGGGNEVQLAGAGLQARWRFARSWSLELLVEGLGGVIGDGFERQVGVVTLSAMWHLTADTPWDFYLLLGVGAVGDKVIVTAASGEKLEQKFKETQVSFGAGLEYHWTHVGLGVELRAVGLAREDHDRALPEEAVPPGSRGAQGSVTLSYYFE